MVNKNVTLAEQNALSVLKKTLTPSSLSESSKIFICDRYGSEFCNISLFHKILNKM
jgi:hypothetical protein